MRQALLRLRARCARIAEVLWQLLVAGARVLRGKEAVMVVDDNGRVRAVIDLGRYRLERKPRDLNGRIRRAR